MDYRIRFTLPRAKDINKEISKILQRKADSITKNPELREYLAQEYINQVTKFVPYKKGTLAGSAFVTGDFRVVWSAVRHGFNYAYKQYWTPSAPEPTKGMYYHSIRYEEHKPTDQWKEQVKPGTPEWSEYMARVSKRITEAYKNG